MRSKKQKEEVNSKSKIILTVLSILLFISAITLGYFCIVYINIKKNNDNLKQELSNLKEEIVNIDSEYTNSSDELDSKKIELKDKIEEYSIWLEMIEKVK